MNLFIVELIFSEAVFTASCDLCSHSGNYKGEKEYKNMRKINILSFNLAMERQHKKAYEFREVNALSPYLRHVIKNNNG